MYVIGQERLVPPDRCRTAAADNKVTHDMSYCDTPEGQPAGWCVTYDVSCVTLITAAACGSGWSVQV